MDAKAAAEQIRADIDPHFASKVDPDDRRSVAFVEEVASHLDMEPNHFNLGHVADALKQHGIEAPKAEEYPKWVDVHPSHIDHDADGRPILPDWAHDVHKMGDRVQTIVHSEDEERRATDPAMVAMPAHVEPDLGQS